MSTATDGTDGGRSGTGGEGEDLFDLTVRPLRTYEELQACVEIQRETWGEESEDHVPASLLSVAVKVGGVVAGAFARGEDAAEPRLVGFVFGLAGWREARPVHWSHMLAVRRPFRNRGIGRRLKRYQREILLELGVATAYWTYDPLVARNAHLNLNLLGARVEDFVTDMYGTGGRSRLHVGGSTDRFMVRWELKSPRVERSLAVLEAEPGGLEEGTPEPSADPPEDLTVVDPRSVAPTDASATFPRDEALRLAIPADVVSLSADDPEEGERWRRGLRATLRHYLSRGYRVAGFLPARGEPEAWYVLRRD